MRSCGAVEARGVEVIDHGMWCMQNRAAHLLDREDQVCLIESEAKELIEAYPFWEAPCVKGEVAPLHALRVSPLGLICLPVGPALDLSAGRADQAVLELDGPCRAPPIKNHPARSGGVRLISKCLYVCLDPPRVRNRVVIDEANYFTLSRIEPHVASDTDIGERAADEFDRQFTELSEQ